MTANHRIVPENSKYDIGGFQPSTGRSLRLEEIIETGIKEGKKFDHQDMIDMQQDMTDVVARGLVSHVVKIVDRILSKEDHKFSPDQKDYIRSVKDILAGFDGVMSEDSIQATVYSYWQYFFYSNLMELYTAKGSTELHKRDEETGKAYWDNQRKLSIFDNYAFLHFF